MITSGRRVVDTAGRKIPLSDQPMMMDCIVLTTLATNTSAVFIGGQGTVSAATGFEAGVRLEPSEAIKFEKVSLQDIWLDAEVSGEGVSWLSVKNNT